MWTGGLSEEGFSKDCAYVNVSHFSFIGWMWRKDNFCRSTHLRWERKFKRLPLSKLSVGKENQGC